jgi:hypothetical protein
MLRAGASFAASKFLFSGGVRMECVPSEDLIGGSIGFRRPGYVLSVEPVVSYKANKTQFYLSVPAGLDWKVAVVGDASGGGGDGLVKNSFLPES